MKKIIFFFSSAVLLYATPSQAQQEQWLKMFGGLDNPSYSSSNMTWKDNWMFSAGCVAHATFVKKNQANAEYFIRAMTGMGDQAVDGWSRMSDHEQNDFFLRSVQYARN
ncbi:hypothetical protein ACMAZH_10870 [Arenicellales bacterium nBUS_45]